MPQQCRKQCVQLTISLNGATPYLICMSVVVEKLLKIADVCVPWVHVYVCVSKMYLCVSKMYICIHENICMCDSKMYICINPCVHLCAFLRYTCVCVQVYPNLCVWVYQRCVCVLVCLFIRNFFSSLSRLRKWPFWSNVVWVFCPSVFSILCFLKNCLHFFKNIYIFANIINVMKGNRRQLSKLTWRHFLFVNFISVNKNMCMIWWFCIWYHVHVATWVWLNGRSVFNNFAQVRNVAYGPFVSSPTY